MYAEPSDLDRDELARTVYRHWDVEVGELRYQAVGFGTHHYRAGSWFVNVDEIAAKTWLGGTPDEVSDGLERSLGTAAALHAAGLDFVHPPRATVDGRHTVALDGYLVSLFAFLDGDSHGYGEFPSDAERREVLTALGRLHAASPQVPPGLPRADSLSVPGRDAFGRSLEEVDRPWTGGPYSEGVRALLRGDQTPVDRRFARYDELVPAVAATRAGWVVTHGEPHAGNVMRTAEGIRLIDWDTVRLGPRERDLWMIPSRDDADWAAYGEADRPDKAALELYRLWWDLSEICGYTAALRAAHVDDGNTRIAWRELRSYLTG